VKVEKSWFWRVGQHGHHTVAPISSAVRNGATIVVGRVAGDFPNSPIELDHIFRLDGDKIASLEIG
jgi:hypothetical protein